MNKDTRSVSMKQLHLICNAHIDPVWLWDIDEGISAALSTFRTAADFCEEYDGFIFNHNEVILYQWVEEYEPNLFARIQKLVKEGKWNIMGGWYLQPDCNMPCGESFIRQIEVGRSYFLKKFGAEPKTAINFDPFGHSRGLVQIMKKAGFDSYLFCRPSQHDCPLPDDDFVWVGFDGSEIMAHRASESYGSLMGEAGKKLHTKMQDIAGNDNGKEESQRKKTDILLWGVGNHGGGPSRVDLDEITHIIGESNTCNICHSTPELFFSQRKADCVPQAEMPVARDLNAWAVGCYTSQIRMKQKHRELEGALAQAEKMLSAAAIKGLVSYPESERKEAEKALLTAEFHDILPGTSIQSVEEMGLRTMEYGLEIVGRLQRKAFFALMEGQEKAAEGEYPILVYNPHPYPVEGIFSCEFQLANQNWSDTYGNPVVFQDGLPIQSQIEKESCNLNLDWRKKVVFSATLAPCNMTRFSCYITWLKQRPKSIGLLQNSHLEFQTEALSVRINKATGLIDSWKTDGKEFLKENGFQLVVLESDKDPWGMNLDGYHKKIGEFELLSKEEGSRYSGTNGLIDSVRVIENGSVRTVVEAVFGFGDSKACIKYILPKKGTAVDIEIRVDWAEKGNFLKLVIPTVLKEACPMGETAYGIMEYEADGKEKVSQRFNGLFDQNEDMAFTCINDGTYGVDFTKGTMRISMLHSAAYSAHPIGDRELLVQDRLLPYIDQGERMFRFRMEAGRCTPRRERISVEAQCFQEKPYIVQAFPSGEGQITAPMVILSNESVLLSAFRQEIDTGNYRIRLFETTGQTNRVTIELPFLGMRKDLEIGGYEIKTFLIDAKNKEWKESTII